MSLPLNDPAWLERMYNNRALVPDHMDYLQRWARDSAQVRAQVPCVLDVAYGTGTGETLDVFPSTRPAGAPVPVLVFIHGGYWRSLDKSDHSFVAEAFTRAGGDDADRANGAGGAEQGRLRALDDLDPFQIVDRLIRPARTRYVGAVVIERHARRLLRRSAVRRDAADDDAGVVRALLLDVKTRDVVGELVEIANAEFLHTRATHGA